jgi:hypothetical protein
MPKGERAKVLPEVKSHIAYTTDNERELAWRRKKEKGERLLSDGDEEKN